MPHSVTQNTEKKRFEIKVDNKTAFMEYMINNQGNMYLTHTEVPKALEGKGIGSSLAKHAIMHIEEQNLKLVPLCPFVASWLRRHKEWSHLLADGFHV